MIGNDPNLFYPGQRLKLKNGRSRLAQFYPLEMGIHPHAHVGEWQDTIVQVDTIFVHTFPGGFAITLNARDELNPQLRYELIPEQVELIE